MATPSCPLTGWSSPRSRGSSCVSVAHRVRSNVVPALAGVIHGVDGNAHFYGRRPRARGGHPWTAEVSQVALVSSPRSRGSSPAGTHVPKGYKVVPALAGVIQRCATRTSPYDQSSPRSRGSSPAPRLRWPARGVVPALAGVIPTSKVSRPARRCRPRARGGHPQKLEDVVAVVASSPRSRGSSLREPLEQVHRGVVPALAGVILRLGPSSMKIWRRPRARGGHPYRHDNSKWQTESSPRSRGSSPYSTGHATR